MHGLKKALTVIGAVTVLVLAANTVTFAATGKSFILGKGNKANQVTALTRTTAGPALKLSTTSSSGTPLAVNGRGKVANLNADLVDGLDSSALRTASYSWTKNVAVASMTADITLPLPAGTYTIGYDAYLQNGGLTGQVAGCYLYRNRDSSTTYYGEVRYATLTGNSVGASGTSIVSVAAGDIVRLYCYAPASWNTDSSQPIRIYATRTAVLGSGALRLAPGAAARTAH